MGYVGQHLTSVVTNYRGGKSGARGRNLIISDKEYAEIKTCYRVDQLGYCNDCRARVASIENECPECGSNKLRRNDDSKWLIGIRNSDEFANIVEPKFYFLVLFDVVDFLNPNTVRASIWRVDSKSPGFALCVVDYYLNIRACSRSRAPFNLWPFQLKFYLMRPILIYQSFVYSNDRFETRLFPNRDDEELCPLKPLLMYRRSTNLTAPKLLRVAKQLGISVKPTVSKIELLAGLQKTILKTKLEPEYVADLIATELYRDEVTPYVGKLPSQLTSVIKPLL